MKIKYIMSSSNYHVEQEIVYENNKYSDNQYIGYYSKKQFENISKKHDRPYIYYKNKDNELVQITEVKQKKNGGSLFKDANSVGAIDVFMYAFQEPVSEIVYKQFDTSNSCFQ